MMTREIYRNRFLFLLLAATATAGVHSFQSLNILKHNNYRSNYFCWELRESTAAALESLETLSSSLESALDACRNDVTKITNVKVAPSPSSGNKRLGLIATKPIKKNEVVLAVPYDEKFDLTASNARKIVFKDYLKNDYEGWTGDTGLIALLILNEVVRASGSSSGNSNNGIQLPKRSEAMQNFMSAWVRTLPSPSEMESLHPLLWAEEDQEILQSSSTNKVYRVLDDLEEDMTWLIENVFSKHPDTFPESVEWNGHSIPCYSVKGFQWAMALAKSRTIFVDGTIRLLPIMDMCNHDDEDNSEEISGGTMGTFGTIRGAQFLAGRAYNVGEEVFCSYGPKSAADYLLEHGFVPPACWKTNIAELSFEVDPNDRFYDDKLDILEYETYDQAPMDPTQSFDLVSAPGRDGDPDPAMIQFLRLSELGATDAFLLEAIFRKEVWGFMALPVSEINEQAVFTKITDACKMALNDFEECPKDVGPEICAKLRESESKALQRTTEYLQREMEALDLKEYYQERRLKDLGLDSEWSPEDDMMGSEDDELAFGQTRLPGGADYDW